ncbi:MarR family winged helix-turn-helix transcriptional regulator [Acuticoccus sp. I52.16.1]|uniref:MarR family winged helix-turn-helix transcriptional regulator n=1 Tax=Acuticoccus sp. I52.16.1 TaxID=2928472 RepID=UPI001FD071B9|nr:MarR family winged helix-turn-helix transcriptional regulator [Acuticoccus sp. I52.16.1]UOM32841.1 MarR family winged helix-turn-helix transcriptional regulator [Acuticoccus sp. I52.16.1]
MSAWPGVIDTRVLDRSLALNLRLASVRCARRIEPAFRDAGLSSVELVALTLIQANPGIRQGHLASTLLLKPAHMTKLVQALQDQDLIERTTPDNDRRAVELHLSHRGEELATIERERVEAFEARMQAGLLSPAEQRQLLKLLKKVWQTEDQDPEAFEVDTVS